MTINEGNLDFEFNKGYNKAIEKFEELLEHNYQLASDNMFFDGSIEANNITMNVMEKIKRQLKLLKDKK